MENKVTMEKSKAQGGEKQLPNETAPSRPGALGLPQAFFQFQKPGSPPFS